MMKGVIIVKSERDAKRGIEDKEIRAHEQC